MMTQDQIDQTRRLANGKHPGTEQLWADYLHCCLDEIERLKKENEAWATAFAQLNRPSHTKTPNL